MRWSVPINISKSRPTCETFKASNFNKLDMHEFHSRHSVSVVFDGANIHVKNFADQLKVTVTNIFDCLAPLQCMTKRCGKLSNAITALKKINPIIDQITTFTNFLRSNISNAIIWESRKR